MHGKQGGNKGFPKTQRVFVPRGQNHEQTRNPTTTSKGPDSTPTLSNSLRQSSLSKQSDAGASAIRVRKGENADWVSNRAPGGSFVNYLPQDEAVAAGLGADEGGLDPVESQRVVDLLNRELSRLLKLKPREFWRQVASDSSLHEFLDSFLKFRSRWYDFPHHGAKGTVAGVIVGEFELSRRVFMVLYRISSNRDPGTRPADSLSPKDHEVLLQEKKLLDLPKLLDICAIYGHENEDLTRILVGNAFKAQPRMHNDLTSVMSHFLNIIRTMHQRCSSSIEALSSSASHGDHESSHLCADMLEVMDFINDAIVSMDALVSAYKPATLFFSSPVEISYGNEELIGTLVKLHDSLLPSLKRGFQMILTSGEDGMASNIGVSLKMLSMRISIFGWKLLELCYLTDEVSKDNLPIPAAAKMFPANVEDPAIRADILVQIFREISEVSLHKEENQNWETFLQKVEKNFNIMRKIENLRNTGWIFMDDEQLKYLSVIFTGSKKITNNESRNVAIPVTNDKVKMDEDAAIMESKISQIKDLFPDYGRGFLLACLEAYNQNPEEVIQRILDGTLHEDLKSLDTSLETMSVPKTTMTISKNDKGKAKLIEPETLPANNLVPTRSMQPNEGPSISSSYSVGRFVRKSKADTNSDSIDMRDEKDLAVNAALMSQYEYEDEYDDSFDDLGLSVAESGFEENEILSDKMSSNAGKPWEKESDTSQIPPSSKWGSRKKPQYYVKDGKNYSYKVEGAVAVANAGEASIVTQAQQELIYGLGRGGNLPLGAVKKLTEASEQQDDKQPDFSETLVRGFGNPRGRARRGGGRHREPLSVEQDKQSGVSEVEGSENLGNHRGRGRRGGGGGRNNHYRKDRSMNKHFSGLSGY